MRNLLKPLQWLYTIYAVVLFIIIMIPVFIWSACVIPFGRIKGGNLVYKGCMFWSDVWLFLVFIHHRNIYLQKLRKGQSYIFVSNHISYLDAAILPQVVRTPVRPLGKIEMTKIPVFGFIYRRAIVTVDRSSASQRAKSVGILKSIINKGISVFVFPEGTFNLTGHPMKDFYDGAFRIAIETGTPIKPLILLDTYKRFHYRSIFSLNPGRSRAIFLPEVSVKGLTIKEVKQLKQKVYLMMEKALIENKASWIQTPDPTHFLK
jgi:1-acyl-sn-glycerol-3-phosphate acyltransferase